jgi:uncharacterized membrane protein
MQKNRIEAFSDGVLAIVITIMVLELKVPHEVSLHALVERVPLFLSYVLSFVYIAIYWNNHHHLLHTIHRINGSILWANNHLLFWLSLVPFVTTWSGENYAQALPVALYGVVLFMAAVAYYILTMTIIATHGKDSVLARAIGRDYKGKISVMLYAAAIPFALLYPLVSLGIYAAVAVMWLIPDSRIEKAMQEKAPVAEPQGR